MFVLTFIRVYAYVLWKISPLVGFLMLIIITLGWWVARIENWPFSRGLYFASITATTVGYGVVHPTTSRSRILSIVIASFGLLLTGIMVALAYQSLTIAADYTGLVDDIRDYFPDFSKMVPQQ